MIDSDSKVPADLEALPDARLKTFSPAELVACKECRRANPPTRGSCLYCGATLPSSELKAESICAASTAPGKHDDQAFNGYYLVDDSGAAYAREGRSAEIASLLQLEMREIEVLDALGGAFPIARVASMDEAGMLADRLRLLGRSVQTFKAEILNLTLPIRKTRALGISTDTLIIYSTSGEEMKMPWADLILMVQGRLVANRTEVEEKRRRGSAKPLSARQFFTDQPVLDFYFAGDDLGWRISGAKFDFSCLGSDKGATVFENQKKLVDRFKMCAPNAEVDDSFQSLRAMLSRMWPPASPEAKRERRRSLTGKIDATIIVATNEVQFHNYSRMRHRLKLLAMGRGE